MSGLKKVLKLHISITLIEHVHGFLEFDQFSEDVQAELIQAEYRGDLGGSPKFLRLFNQGQYRQAADEFLDNADYRRSLKNKTGVHKRMERVSTLSPATQKRRGQYLRLQPTESILKSETQVTSLLTEILSVIQRLVKSLGFRA